MSNITNNRVEYISQHAYQSVTGFTSAGFQ